MSKMQVFDTESILRLEQGQAKLFINNRAVSAWSTHCPVTHRSFSDYQTAYPPVLPAELVLFPGMQVFEVGPGLGGLLTALYDREPAVRLTAVDPAPFGDIRDLLGAAMEINDPRAVIHRPLLQELTERVNFLLSPNVCLINTTLERAVLDNPALHGAADLVVDYCGATTYSSSWQLEALFLPNPPEYLNSLV